MLRGKDYPSLENTKSRTSVLIKKVSKIHSNQQEIENRLRRNS